MTTMTTEITPNLAQEIAARGIEQLRLNSRLAGYDDFSPAELLREDERTWTFVSGSQRLQDEGVVPGAIFVRVDKSDGHIWTNDEIERHHTARPAQLVQSSARVA